MAIAEIHGKIATNGSNLHERLEDLLTANVFGPTRYVADGSVLIKLLSMAQCVNGEGRFYDMKLCQQLLSLGPTVTAPTIKFWPDMYHSEPDILCRWDLGERRLTVMVEVKYNSGKSGSGFAYNNEGDEHESEPAVSDQLGREYMDLLSLDSGADTFALIYLTAHTSLPAISINESLQVISSLNLAHIPVYWLGWVDVYRAVRDLREAATDSHTQSIWEDIENLLIRKGLTGLRPWVNVALKLNSHLHPWYEFGQAKAVQSWPATQFAHSFKWTYKAEMACHWPTVTFTHALSSFYSGR